MHNVKFQIPVWDTQLGTPPNGTPLSLEKIKLGKDIELMTLECSDVYNSIGGSNWSAVANLLAISSPDGAW